MGGECVGVGGGVGVWGVGVGVEVWVYMLLFSIVADTIIIRMCKFSLEFIFSRHLRK